ncbi:hypothetical protein AKG98_3754 [Moritella sp. JT01]|uniref:hypothetical protein n=1 Tax=Moritella sp. JT01 TaxID=756698 RepID=UPI00079A5D91|nr:hypothetical protein [Moritella sp. JT01]KXO12560.1 hypothetical protein AKG98_3754 [Moritella sp. JT01]
MINISRISKTLLTAVGLLSISTHALSTENKIQKNAHTEPYDVSKQQQDLYNDWYESALAKKDFEIKMVNRQSATREGKEIQKAMELYVQEKDVWILDDDDEVISSFGWYLVRVALYDEIENLDYDNDPSAQEKERFLKNYIALTKTLSRTTPTHGELKIIFADFFNKEYKYIEYSLVNNYVQLHQPGYDDLYDKEVEDIEGHKVKIEEFYDSFNESFGIDVEYKVGVFGLDKMESAGLFSNNKQQIEVNTKLRATYTNSETGDTELLDITVNDYKEGLSLYEESSGNYINHDWKNTDNIYNNGTNPWHVTVNKGEYVGHLPTNICHSGTNVPEYNSGGFTEQESAKTTFYISTSASPASQQMCTSLNLTLSNYYDLPIIYDSCKTRQQKFPVTAFKPVTYGNDDIKVHTANQGFTLTNYTFTDKNSKRFMDYEIIEYGDLLFPSEHSDQQGHRFIRGSQYSSSNNSSMYASLYRNGAKTNLAGLEHKNCILPLKESPLPNGLVASMYRIDGMPVCYDENIGHADNWDHPLAIKLIDKYGNKSETMTIHHYVTDKPGLAPGFFWYDSLRFTMNGRAL